MIKKIYKYKLKNELAEKVYIKILLSKNIFINQIKNKIAIAILRKDIYLDVQRLLESKKRKDTHRLYEDGYKDLKTRFRNIDASTYPVDRWELLSLYFISVGMFTLGWICREKSKKQLYSKMKKKRGKGCYKYILALIEDGKIGHASKQVDIIKKDPRYKILKKEIDLIGSFLEILTVIEKGHSMVDDAYRSFIEDKSILVIGPTMSLDDIDHNLFLDEKDVVVRNNVDVDSPPSKIKVDISYYNGEGVKKIRDRIKNYMDKISYIVIKSEEKGLEERRGKIHRSPDVSDLMYMGTANMLPIMLVDLLLHRVGKIFVCGNNLFLSRNAHAKGYMFDPGKESLKKSFVEHNLFSQHMFLKLLYENSKFGADQELGNVLQMSTKRYAEEMERIY